VLSGAAGTGKTTVIRAILENIDRVWHWNKFLVNGAYWKSCRENKNPDR